METVMSIIGLYVMGIVLLIYVSMFVRALRRGWYWLIGKEWTEEPRGSLYYSTRLPVIRPTRYVGDALTKENQTNG